MSKREYVYLCVLYVCVSYVYVLYMCFYVKKHRPMLLFFGKKWTSKRQFLTFLQKLFFMLYINIDSFLWVYVCKKMNFKTSSFQFLDVFLQKKELQKVNFFYYWFSTYRTFLQLKTSRNRKSWRFEIHLFTKKNSIGRWFFT